MIVYTCPFPQPNKCDFFLWLEDAKPREVAAFNNASSEPQFSPHTPVKNHSALVTPPTTIERKDSAAAGSQKIPSPSTPSKSLGNFQPLVLQNTQSSNSTSTIKATAAEEDDDEDEEFYDWPSSDDEELRKAASNLPSSNLMPPPPTTPRKAMKTDIFSTPGKRSSNDEEGNSLPITRLNFATPSRALEEDDVFTTPNAATPPRLYSLVSNHSNLPSPAETPTPRRFRDIPLGQDSDLTTQILQLFERKMLPPLSSELKDEIRAISNKHHMYTRGVVSGREISRAMIKKKSAEIAELQGTIAGLEAEREAQLSLIRKLRQELLEK